MNVDGMTIGQSEIASITIGGIDGDIVNQIQAQPRGIVMDLRIKEGVNVEDAKRAILQVVKLKQQGTLKWTQNGRTVQIAGVVEAITMPRFNNAVTMQITMHCAQPFWEDVDEIAQQIDEFINLHYFTTDPQGMLYFPVSGIAFGEYDESRTRNLYNDGDVAVGMDITILALTTVTNPLLYDSQGRFFGVGYNQTRPINKNVIMQAGDVIKISTHKGNKTVTWNGTNVIDKVKPQSTWFQLAAGDNEFSITSDDAQVQNMTFYITYKRRYL